MALLLPVIFCLSALVGAQHLPASNERRDGSPIVPGQDAFPLRILPLGASITWGQGSSDGNGYREHLRTLLLLRGTVISMVGTVNSGTMINNENEGHPGARLDEVAKWVEKDRQFAPNLVLINVGTNDVLREDPNFPLGEIGARMENLIEDLFRKIPDVTIVLSTLLPNKNAPGNDKIHNEVNPRYKAIVKSGQKKKQRIVLADLHSALTTKDLIDGTHPTDEGYKKVAEAWLPAIYEAGRGKMLVNPRQSSPRTEVPFDHDITHLSTTETPTNKNQVKASQAPKANAAEADALTLLAWLVPCACLGVYVF